MQKHAPRARLSCDACAFRRVKCSGGQPCAECSARSVSCTQMRRRRKRGPKGPRSGTAERIQHHQETLVRKIVLPTSPASTDSETTASPLLPASWAYGQAPAAYYAHLETFRRQLYTVWPILDSWKLLKCLETDPNDWQSRALAASLCSAVIAQLRLDQCPDRGVSSQASAFAKEAQMLRMHHDFRESTSMDSLLTSFFLHIYFSNVQNLSTAAYLLRESATTAHLMRLHEPETYETLPRAEYQRRLRIFWVLFVTERTFCAQNDLMPILEPISELPTFDDQDPDSNSSLAGFVDLARLFICLEASFFRCEPPSRVAAGSQKDRVKILCIQKQLEQDVSFPGISETQRVDLNITRHWIRAIIWRYTITHFAQSSQSTAPAFSATYPAQIAKDSLTLLANASTSAIRAHGYGMELKILLLANSVLDVLACLPNLKFSIAAHDWRNALCALGDILHTVGGGDSHFAALLKRRMAEAGLPCPAPRELPLPVLPLLETGYAIEMLPGEEEVYEAESVPASGALAVM